MRIFIIIITLLINSEVSVGQDSTKFKILIYGLPHFEREDARKVVAKKWDINFYAVADCVVDQDLLDSVAKENKIHDERITALYGKDWRDKFETEVDKEYHIHQQISKLIDKQKFIKIKSSELEKAGESLFYKIQSTGKEKIYYVVVDSWAKWKGKDEFIIYYKLEVDYKRRSIKMLSDLAMVE